MGVPGILCRDRRLLLDRAGDPFRIFSYPDELVSGGFETQLHGDSRLCFHDFMVSDGSWDFAPRDSRYFKLTHYR